VRIFKYTRFNRFANKEGITDTDLKDILKQLDAGQADADLGGGVYKVRQSRSGEGKSSGYRLIVYFKSGHRTFFAYGFSKSDKSNISNKELLAFKADAKDQFALTDEQIDIRIKKGTLIEVS